MSDRPDRNRRRQKLKQLCAAVDRYVVQLANHFTIYERCAAGEYDLDAARNLLANRGIVEDRPLKAAQTLFESCLPDLQTSLLEIARCEARGLAEIVNFKQGYQRGQFTSEEIVDGPNSIHGSLRDADEGFKGSTVWQRSLIIETADQQNSHPFPHSVVLKGTDARFRQPRMAGGRCWPGSMGKLLGQPGRGTRGTIIADRT